MTGALYTHVVGSPIAHSLSPVIFDAAAVGVCCERAEVPAGGLAEFLSGEGRSDVGLSVTMPLKKEAFEVCTWVDPLAQSVNAINTLVREDALLCEQERSSCAEPSTLCCTDHGAQRFVECTVRGYNTDIQGIVEAVRETLMERVQQVSSVLIIGSGSTASSALAAVQDLDENHAMNVTVCARRSAGAGTVFEVAERLGVHVGYVPFSKAAQALVRSQLVICTLPFHAADPLAEQLRSLNADLRNVALLDAAYNPYPSELTKTVLAGGGTNIPGYEMLIHQGLAQARLFSGREPDSQAVHDAIYAAIAARSTI